MKKRAKPTPSPTPQETADNLTTQAQLPTDALSAREMKHTVAEISAHWKCCRETVRRKIRTGELQSECPAGKYLVLESVLVAYEKANKMEPRRPVQHPSQNSTTQDLS